jgi:dihydrofolate synthase/folylpolyglutamate synthase
MEPVVDFDDLCRTLDALGLFRMNPSLDRMLEFVRITGLERLPHVSVHVVGTNAKGSVSAHVEALARSHGLRTGLFTSPHFLDFRERVLVDGSPLGRAAWVGLANRVIATGVDLTYFEFLTAAAMLAFVEYGVEVAVYEAGLGGTWDAANTTPHDLTVFTPIGLDHTAVLGPTVQAVARDKAGAMRPGATVLTCDQEPAVMAVLAEQARKTGAVLNHDLDLVRGLGDLPADCSVNAANMRQALAAWRLVAPLLGLEPEAETVRQALAGSSPPGRIQVVGNPGHGLGPLVLDMGHNPHALRGLAKALGELCIQPRCVVFNCLADKDLDGMADVVARLAGQRVLVPAMPGCGRARDPLTVAAALGKKAEPRPDAAAALAECRSGEGWTLVCGSAYLLAEVFACYPSLLHTRIVPSHEEST